ncbi:PEP-CTERM sorting domain-containing protein [Rhodopirellula europaea]|uniref:Secreted protein containing PEP-CTERM bacterial domain protein n=1 Tax=Rhodopirellula europaea 6C TaxID=1263867 RepID=M2AWD2_9BACT|nr:PEP-CTERM sorting domain-containing protein [Rhodopirellula europaea]EMB13873.1 secreted protein containing PEP-CTERM bacterial domain protein [Rhodopirellula europaea 6C]
MKTSISFCTLLLTFSFCHSSSAALVLQVGNGTGTTNPVQVSDTIGQSIRIFATNDGVGDNNPFDLNGYGIYFQFGNDGEFGIPTGFVFNSTSAQAVAGGYNNDGNVGFDADSAATADLVAALSGNDANYDFIVSDTNGGFELGVGETTALFDLVFDVLPGTTGTYELNLVAVPDPGVSGITGASDQFNTSPADRAVTILNGSVTINASAVPEPSSLLALGGAAVFSGLLQRRRKQRQATV